MIMTAIEKIRTYADEFEKMPGVTVIHDIEGFKPLFMTSNGLKLLGISMEELIAIKEDYQELFFNRNFMGDYLEQLKAMFERDGITETYTFFHEVKIREEFRWYSASIKVFHASKNFEPTHTITYAVPLEDYHWTIKRAQRLLEETEFARKHLEKFSSLSSREKEVLALIAKGKTVGEITDTLKISPNTVNSHLKTIKRKLKATTSYDLREFALAFDLV